MLTKQEIDSNFQHLRLSPREPSRDITNVIESLIHELQGPDAATLGVETNMVILLALRELLRRTAPQMGRIPAMTGFDPPMDADGNPWNEMDDEYNEAVSDHAKNDAELHK